MNDQTLITPEFVDDILEHVNEFLIEDSELRWMSYTERGTSEACLDLGRLVRVFIHTIRCIYGGIKDVDEQQAKWIVRYIEANVSIQWLNEELERYPHLKAVGAAERLLAQERRSGAQSV